MATSNSLKIRALEKELDQKKTVYRKNLEKLLSNSSLTEAQKSNQRKKYDEEVRALKREILKLKAKI